MVDYLQRVANQFLFDLWGETRSIPIYINKRLKKDLGTYVYKDDIEGIVPVSIQLSSQFVQFAEMIMILDVLKHELCHYVLSLRGYPFLDNQLAFEMELERVQCNATKNIVVQYQVLCPICEVVYNCKSNKHAKRVIERYSKSPCCSTEYKYVGVKYLYKLKKTGKSQ